jgi:hypothetical protein
VTALDKAIEYFIDEFGLADKAYDIRERLGPDDFTGKNANLRSSWDHPKVKRFARHLKVLQEHLKRARGAE